MNRPKLINRWILIGLAFLSLQLYAGACMPFHKSDADSLSEWGLPDITWPPPPQQARIKFAGIVAEPEDIGIEKTWMTKMVKHIFGSEESLTKLLRPYGIFADSGRIYITDPGSFTVHVFDKEAKKYFPIYSIGSENFMSPIGISVDRNGDIFVTDSMLHRVAVFDKKGKYLRDILICFSDRLASKSTWTESTLSTPIVIACLFFQNRMASYSSTSGGKEKDRVNLIILPISFCTRIISFISQIP